MSNPIPGNPAFGSVAIVGIGGLFPDAPDLDRFWQNIVAAKSSAREVPPERWAVPADAAFSPEVGAKDRVYSRKGCFISAIPRTAPLPGLSPEPKIPSGLDPLFHLLLHVGRQAYSDGITSPLDRSRVGVIIGNLALPTEKSSLFSREILGKTFEEQLLGRTSAKGGTAALNRYVAGLPAGLLAYSLGLGGGACTLDAACASSLYAIKLACDELLAGRADAMLSGGVSRPDPLYTQMGFSQLRALSKRGICSPFDAAGDGLLVGEGAGIFLLKRTEDAIAHGDRIYGIIRGAGLSNDVGGSLLAPMSEGQLRAMRAAYRQAGWQPRDVDLIECHATGTPVGDATEVASLKELWGDAPAEGTSCVIGSVKSNIGHLLTAAGAAALTKVLLAMRAGVLPPTAGFNSPQPGMELAQSPFRVLSEPLPWNRRAAGMPRRAAVSAFGFGGINAHLLIEEWLPEMADIGETIAVAHQWLPTSAPSGGVPVDGVATEIAVVGMDARFAPCGSLRAFQEQSFGNSAAAPQPAPPAKWWGASGSDWFRAEGLQATPFNGHYLDSVTVPADQFRIPPLELEEMLPQQLLMLQSAAAALADAGIDREGNLDTGVFIGIALDLGSTTFSYRWTVPQRLAGWSAELGIAPDAAERGAWCAALQEAASPPLTANRTMGALGNIVASRIAREFRCGGPSFTLSSEESSGIRSLAAAVRLLQQGELDRAVVGAVDLAGDLRAVLGQHADRPFSPTGSARPFAADADGTIPGEGAASVVLKRLADARADGDRIYAVIKGVGLAGGELIVPGTAACSAAMERACDEAGIVPSRIDFIETHGSGFPREDRMELAALSALFAADESSNPLRHRERSTALGAVKGGIGHCGAASGLASLVRTALALYQEIIPGSAAAAPLPDALAQQSPFYLPAEPRYWLRNRADGPRYAGVNCFSVDGSCTHVILAGAEEPLPRAAAERVMPLGGPTEFLFTLPGADRGAIAAGLDALAVAAGNGATDLGNLASSLLQSGASATNAPLALAMVARNREELLALIALGKETLQSDGDAPLPPPTLRDRLFFSPAPLGKDGRIAFVFPGSGNHFAGMGMPLSVRWPEIFRRQDSENLYLRSQFQPEVFWNGADPAVIDRDHRAVIFGQVATGCAASDVVRSFGVSPSAVIGYSLGESAGLFALGAWQERDSMLLQMYDSTLFTDDLAGECRAAARAWGIPDGKGVDWQIGVVNAPAREVRRAIRMTTRVYLLIVNTPHECVIGGDAKGVKRVVAILGSSFFPLSGVTTVHCEVAREVAEPYRNLHLFPTQPPPGVTYYSGAEGGPFEVTRESAADAILAQALEGINYPAVINAAYNDGVRIFLEMGPGASCSRMISQILEERPHLARSVCAPGVDGEGAVLRLLASLVAERAAVDLSPLLTVPATGVTTVRTAATVTVAAGGRPFALPLPPAAKTAEVSPAPAPTAAPPLPPVAAVATAAALAAPSRGALDRAVGEPPPGEIPLGGDPLLRDFAAAQEAKQQAHASYLRFSDSISQTMAQALSLELALQQALGGENPPPFTKGGPGGIFPPQPETNPPLSPFDKGGQRPHPCVFDRNMCLEFATGSVARMLGAEFAAADSFPTRVRLPDEPLMLVDRITLLEGEPKSMSHGRVVTEHDIHAGAWYLDGGRIPTCIAVEAGQADLFLSGFLGIDFITKGLAVYRLLDAVVTFHRGLPGPGEIISYDIRIERFFRQGDTWLFRFFFEATVGGEPLLSMRDGCAGFFNAAELEAGKGIVRPSLDLRPTSGSRPADWQELVPMGEESYTATQLQRLRAGDLAGCFGPLFAGLPLSRPLTIPGGKMELVHRVMELQPRGGRYGEGFIRAEADIHPDDWFITCHFVDDRVMPGTLMYECCMHTLRIFLLRMGWVAEASGAVWEPVPGVASGLRCRGQVLETTKVVTYEVTIRELGYRPEPYVIGDALMYADGKPIVEITNMSARLAGTTKEQLLALWKRVGAPLTVITEQEQGRGEQRPYLKPAIYSKEQILAYSNGNPSAGFGDRYRIFDAGMGRKIARLPGPPFQFMDRVTALRGEPWQMVAGAMAEAQYDIPVDAWYFAADGQPRMPFAVLLEAALQPCGWLAAYVGSALASPADISFRNLGGTAVQHRAVTPESGTITCTAVMKKVATSGGMIIQEFDFTVADAAGLIYEGDTMFGFFSKEALANQVGIRDAKPYQPTAAETGRGRSLVYPADAPFPEKQLRMIDRIELYVEDGGPQGYGYLRGVKDVNPDEWFFKAHFYEDPVTPGSLGLESFVQLLKFAAVERWGWQPGNLFEAAALEETHRWLYRGQVIPTNRQVTVEAWITAVDDNRQTITAAGFLSVDGKLIYQMNDFTVRIITTDRGL
jgi:acyl transferase domain-containing protein/3-hydroxymyristoyl/3-hydroxydecanoyl-(acyl carrier protein) dehydratase